MQTKINVVLAEDEVILREGIAAKIEKLDEDFQVTAQADNGSQALEALEQLSVDVLITDIKMPEMDGIELIRKVRLSYPKVKVVILSGYCDFSYTQQAIRYGVSSYLLKPVEDEALLDVLLELKNEILTAQFYRHPTTVYSDRYQRGISRQMDYYLFSLSIGNLCYDAMDPDMRSWYSCQPEVNWQSVLDKLPAQDWWIRDEEAPNQKLICLRCPKSTPLDGAQTANILRQRMEEALTGQHVSICASTTPQSREDVPICAQRLRNILRQQLIPAQSCLFLLEQDETSRSEERLSIVKMRVQDQLRQSIQRGDRQEICRELTMIFRYMVNLPASQLDLQKVITYVIRMCEFSGMENLADGHKSCLRVLSCAADRPHLTEVLVNAIADVIAPQERPEDIGKQLVEYVDQHYLQLDHLEDLTQVFSYSYEHLSRLFKKQTGISLSRYVQEKRLALAKQLITENNVFHVSQIAEMSGFSDRRNFLRTFKAYTGMSPAEYKKSAGGK